MAMAVIGNPDAPVRLSITLHIVIVLSMAAQEPYRRLTPDT